MRNIIYPDTCACVIEIITSDRRKWILLEQCRTHNTVAETLAHNKPFATGDNSRDSEADIEREKAIYQRR